MEEFAKVILDTILKKISIESLLKFMRKNKENKIGTELFLTYTAINNILVVGKSIVTELEQASKWMEKKLKDNEPDRVYFNGIDFKLNQQIMNLIQLQGAISRLKFEVQLISPEVFNEITPLIEGKIHFISLLKNAISGEENSPQLVSVSEQKLLEIMEKPNSKTSRRNDIIFNDGLITNEGIDNFKNLQAKQYHIIKSYLDNRKPKLVLENIEKNAKLLREAIANNFTIKDILLEVSDYRCENVLYN